MFSPVEMSISFRTRLIKVRNDKKLSEQVFFSSHVFVHAHCSNLRLDDWMCAQHDT